MKNPSKHGFRILNKESAVLLANGYMLIAAADKQTGESHIESKGLLLKS